MGKGSARRKEDISAVHEGHTRIFGESPLEKRVRLEREAKENKEKPVVYFSGEPVFDTESYPGHEVARVYALHHYVLGTCDVRTSSVLKKFDDGSFETRNTLYKPAQGDLFQ
jgi:hypothetical protein